MTNTHKLKTEWSILGGNISSSPEVPRQSSDTRNRKFRCPGQKNASGMHSCHAPVVMPILYPFTKSYCGSRGSAKKWSTRGLRSSGQAFSNLSAVKWKHAPQKHLNLTKVLVKRKYIPQPTALPTQMCWNSVSEWAGKQVCTVTFGTIVGKLQEWCMTTPTTKQQKIGPIFYWLFHKGARYKSHFAPADRKSNLPLSFQSQKQGLIVATRSLTFNMILSLSLSNLQPRVDRRRQDLIQSISKTEGLACPLKTNWKSGVGYVPASINFLCCVVVIADVSAQAVGGVKGAFALSTGIPLHRLAREQKDLLITGRWIPVLFISTLPLRCKKTLSHWEFHWDFGVPFRLSPTFG